MAKAWQLHRIFRQLHADQASLPLIGGDRRSNFASGKIHRGSAHPLLTLPIDRAELGIADAIGKRAERSARLDRLQLIGIAAHEQKWIPKFLRKWLGFRLQKPGMLEVCSTLAIKALLEAWARLILDDGLSEAPMPLEDINRDSFDVCPADFEHSVTMKLLAEINV